MCEFGQHKSRTKMPKDAPDAESQKTRKRLHMDNNNPMGSSTRRKLSIDDVPGNIRDVAGAQMDQIQIWPNSSIVTTMQQLEDDASQGVGDVQILLGLIGERNPRTTTLARQ